MTCGASVQTCMARVEPAVEPVVVSVCGDQFGRGDMMCCTVHVCVSAAHLRSRVWRLLTHVGCTDTGADHVGWGLSRVAWCGLLGSCGSRLCVTREVVPLLSALHFSRRDLRIRLIAICPDRA